MMDVYLISDKIGFNLMKNIYGIIMRNCGARRPKYETFRRTINPH